MQGVTEMEQRVVEVVAELVEQRSQEGFERDDLPLLGGQHPDRDVVAPVSVAGFVQPVQLAPTQRGASERDLDSDRRDPEVRADTVGDPLREHLDVARASGREDRGQRRDRRREPGLASKRTEGTRSLAAATFWSAGGSRRYQAGRGPAVTERSIDLLYPILPSPPKPQAVRSAWSIARDRVLSHELLR